MPIGAAIRTFNYGWDIFVLPGSLNVTLIAQA
jgi:hypothetical protein